MSGYVPTIGLEIHAELKTATKMFCNSKNDPEETRPNVNICPVCLAHPGTLPVINREAVRHVLKVGVALGGKFADYTEFDRKNYFYPDLPKGYQISQYEYPLVSGGSLRGVAITRVHLEEDTASSIHYDATGETLIDYNRSGVPLMELVTEPVIKSAKEAGDFARELQLLLRCLGASDANMEKGEMRVEANVSIAPAAETFASADTRGQDADGRGKYTGTDVLILRDSASSQRSSAVPLGTKIEIKNLNSFRAMERAVEYEIKRQTAILKKGEAVVQETRGWDEGKQTTFSQRTKEGSADYRYFPDPDLPSLKLSEIEELRNESLAASMPELPWERRSRYLGFGIKDEDAQLYVQEPALGGFFEEVITFMGGDSARILLASNYIANDLVAITRDAEKRDTGYQSKIPTCPVGGKASIGISAQNFKKIIDMVTNSEISSRVAKDLLAESIKSGRNPEEVAKSENLYQVSAGDDFEAVVMDVVSKNPSVVSDFKAGKAAALEYLVGQAMKATRGTANPEKIREMVRSRLLN